MLYFEDKADVPSLAWLAFRMVANTVCCGMVFRTSCMLSMNTRVLVSKLIFCVYVHPGE